MDWQFIYQNCSKNVGVFYDLFIILYCLQITWRENTPSCQSIKIINLAKAVSLLVLQRLSLNSTKLIDVKQIIHLNKICILIFVNSPYLETSMAFLIRFPWFYCFSAGFHQKVHTNLCKPKLKLFFPSNTSSCNILSTL